MIYRILGFVLFWGITIGLVKAFGLPGLILVLAGAVFVIELSGTEQAQRWFS